MTARPENSPADPYVGLRPFEFHEAALFYGRGEHIAEMVRTLRKRHFLAVVGSSGSGKSSLVRAGLLPAIAAGFMDGGEEGADWRFVLMRPGRDPYENLLRELLPQLAPGQELDPKTIEFRRQTLRGGPRGLVEAVADSLLPEPARLVVLVDQFEEIFRFLERGGPSLPEDGGSLADRRNAALAFVDMLLATVAERDPHVYVVLTMRSEYLGECEAFLGLSAAIAKSQFLTPRMTREQIKDIIERPIQAVGGRIEPQVVTDLLNALGTAQDQLPRVEHCLLRMWDRAGKIREEHPEANRPPTFTPDDYRAVGRFETALDLHGEQLFWDLGSGSETPHPTEKQRVAEHLFRSLAVRSPQGALVRRLCSLGEVASIAGVSEQVVAEVVEHFRQPGCNFLVATPSAPLTGSTTLDISHEALLRQWVRLGKWLDEEAKSAADYCHLEADARSWQKEEKGFLQSPELDISLRQQRKWTPDWARRYGTDFDLAMRYLKESEAEKKRRDAEDEARRNELAAERARAAQQVQRVARFRWAVAVLSIGFAVITVLAYIAIRKSSLATEKSIEAGKQRSMAEMQKAIATKQSKIATAQSIAARAYLLLDGRLDTALLLATEAQELATQAQPLSLLPDTVGTLVTGAYYNRRLLTYLHGTSPVSAVAFNSDGTRVATGRYDGEVALWDVRTHLKDPTKRDPIAKMLGITDAVRAISFSADGHYMAVSDKVGTVGLLDLRTWEKKPLPAGAGQRDQAWSLAFSRDSTLMASGAEDGSLAIWNLAGGSPVTLVTLAAKGAIRALSFDPVATTPTLAAGCADGQILIWTRQGDEWTLPPAPAEPESKQSAVRCLAISPDGKYLAVGRISGVVDLCEMQPWKVVASGQHDGPVNSLAFSPDSNSLITSGNDSTLRLWSVPMLTPDGTPFNGHVGRVFAVAFSGNNRTVVSGGEDHSAILWDTSVRVDQPRNDSSEGDFSIAFSPDGEYEADGYEGGAVDLGKRGVRSPAPRRVMSKSEGTKTVPVLAFSGDSLRLAATMADGKLLVCATDAGPTPIEIPAANEHQRITAIALNKDGSLVAAALSQKGVRPQIRIWNVATRELTGGPFDCDEGEKIYTIQFSPDSSRLAAGGIGQFVSIWPLTGDSPRKPVKCREEHTGSIRDIAFNPDGKTFATASGDTTIILWDADTGRRISPPLTGHHAPIVAIAFSSDGRMLASGSADRSVVLWDVNTAVSIGRLTGHTDTVRTLAFSPDSAHLYSGSFASRVGAEDGGLLAWELDPKALMQICRQRANRELSPTERATYLRDVRHPTTSPAPPDPGGPPPLK